MPYKIALTGYAGFLGTYLRHYATQRNIACVNITSNLNDADGLFQEIQTHDFECLIHMASLNTPSTQDLDYYQTNLLGSENLFKALAYKHQIAPIKHVILCSTSHVYKSSEHPIKENHDLCPMSHYALSKYAMEQRALSYNLPFCIIRLFNTIGLGQKANFLMPKIIQAYKNQASHLTLGNIEVKRDFSCVRWVVNALLDLITQDTLPQTLNICSNQSHSIKEILAWMEQATNHHCHIMQDSKLIRQEAPIIRGDNALLLSLSPTPPPHLYQTLEWMLQDS